MKFIHDRRSSILFSLHDSRVKGITYYNETVEEAYKSRRKWEAEQWEYDSWVSTYTAIEKGEQEGVSLDIEKVLGRPATSIEQLLEEYIV